MESNSLSNEAIRSLLDQTADRLTKELCLIALGEKTSGYYYHTSDWDQAAARREVGRVLASRQVRS